MSEPAFTPGPWDAPKPTVIDAKAWQKLHCDEPMQFITVGWDGFSGETVAIVYGDDDEQEIANARLIAAAPDLYAALSALCETLNGNGYATDHANAALAKARGDT